jgi:predicted O-methyltransferase YrrM
MKAVLYAGIFEKERRQEYPSIDAVERACGFAVNRDELEAAARVLACPLKVHAPNWQHGRVIYAVARKYLLTGAPVMLDIGTAKGFSACVLSWALRDAGIAGEVVSIDLVDPLERVRRNSVAELDGLRTVPEFVDPFRACEITFLGGGSLPWLDRATLDNRRVGFAFIDGKHSFEAVQAECRLLPLLQQPGDVVIFDDLQIEPVARAVATLRGYEITEMRTQVRRYAIAVRQ